jgi:hypothetical protein
MDALQHAKIEALKKALRSVGESRHFDFRLDEKTGKIVVTKKQEKKQKKDKPIDSRFDILDL